MDNIICLAIFLQVFLSAVMVVVFNDLMFVLPILGYVVLGEILKYTKSMMLRMDVKTVDGPTDEKQKYDVVKKMGIPVIRSRFIYASCRALDIKAQLEIKFVPTVKSPKIWQFCKELGLKATLEFPESLGMEDNFPILFLKEVFLLCKALDIKAKLHE